VRRWVAVFVGRALVWLSGLMDFRFTCKDDALYAICLGVPQGRVLIESLKSLYPDEIASVRLLGIDCDLESNPPVRVLAFLGRKLHKNSLTGHSRRLSLDAAYPTLYLLLYFESYTS
jgi:hypothetical protein